ncbi:MAG: hypothetical protein H2B00_05335 [Nitrosopumilaceae archaeon]|jgi:KaiC/GvpD/RAD55 family RecA-like ATPase|uniref:Uncharacterized protein n=2 Tax=Candidatus Nitrosomaritimum aestuariumsis TaxID=3342354 RepID=A0AC60W946_9ARCH|nr:hypothetical protein [Nitrosopumilaceae archaeon]MBA4460562.1 hypothetical protein [Nitrosopumilaceae archaeon]MBA4461917.1 hypothetical protein [Nitrosopumilaceae archaeon]MBA4463997.1 hypothetical protein [Nitrosopumilaceae archaeon]
MSEDDKGKRFLELIDNQNNLQWSIIEKLTFLIKDEWNSSEKQKELESLVEKHSEITKELNSLDVDNSIL